MGRNSTTMTAILCLCRGTATLAAVLPLKRHVARRPTHKRPLFTAHGHWSPDLYLGRRCGHHQGRRASWWIHSRIMSEGAGRLILGRLSTMSWAQRLLQ
ncbi:hypothetical protein BDZ94DRAFT_1260385 [Collybia nuda]|uniref:Secreted protein n=1 Tax=Collybia nuda TaxID=64659 RepID=A0A9P5Y7N4_9AGAR|nr:hypothetical protein BDZ94DRAFT_1260385 [Collybia nuda]